MTCLDNHMEGNGRPVGPETMVSNPQGRWPWLGECVALWAGSKVSERRDYGVEPWGYGVEPWGYGVGAIITGVWSAKTLA